MQANLARHFELHAHGDEIDTLKRIVLLAAKHLELSPVQQLSGTPHKRQAGIRGNDLILVKETLTRLAKELGLGELSLEPNSRKTDALDALLFGLMAASVGPAQNRGAR